MQKGVDQVSDSCDGYDLTISIKKTVMVYQPAPEKPYKEPTITVKGERLQVVDKFSSAILEHTNNNTSCIGLGLVSVSNDRWTNT